MNDGEKHQHCTNKFIELANELAREEDFPRELVNAALMAASGVYATFVAAGNQGGLEPSGVDRVAELYRRNLEHIQRRKREELQKEEGGDSGNA